MLCACVPKLGIGDLFLVAVDIGVRRLPLSSVTGRQALPPLLQSTGQSRAPTRFLQAGVSSSETSHQARQQADADSRMNWAGVLLVRFVMRCLLFSRSPNLGGRSRPFTLPGQESMQV